MPKFVPQSGIRKHCPGALPLAVSSRASRHRFKARRSQKLSNGCILAAALLPVAALACGTAAAAANS